MDTKFWEEYLKNVVFLSNHDACHCRHAYLSKHAYGSVGMVSRLRSGRLRNRSSIPGRYKRFIFPPKHLWMFWRKNGPPTFSFSGYKRFFPLGDAARAWSETLLLLLPRLGQAEMYLHFPLCIHDVRSDDVTSGLKFNLYTELHVDSIVNYLLL